MRKHPQPKYVVPYHARDFVWIRSHHDFHLDGLCLFLGKLHRFETHEMLTSIRHTNTKVVCEVFSLSVLESISWKIHKALFEKCVGKHWTYSNWKQIVDERPVSVALFKTYYLLKKFIF